MFLRKRSRGPRRLILHIGARKCGSSSLQQFLSQYPVIKGEDTYRYVAFTEQGDILAGQKLKEQANRVSARYASSQFHAFADNPDALTEALIEVARRIPATDTVVISAEGMDLRSELFSSTEAIVKAGFAAEAVYFVRPQIGYFNTAWWQWNVWVGDDLEHWIRADIARAQWNRHIRAWKSVPGVAKVEVFDAARGSVAQFCAYAGIANGRSNIRSNKASPAALLDFLQRNREFRPHQHDPSIEFLLANHVTFTGKPVPFVLTKELQKFIFESSQDDFREMLDEMPEARRAEFLQNPEWLDPDFHADRPVSPVTGYCSQEDRDALIGDLIRAIQALTR